MVTDFIVLTKASGELVALRVDIIAVFDRQNYTTYIECDGNCYNVIEKVEEIIKLIDNCK